LLISEEWEIMKSQSVECAAASATAALHAADMLSTTGRMVAIFHTFLAFHVGTDAAALFMVTSVSIAACLAYYVPVWLIWGGMMLRSIILAMLN